MAIRMMLVFGVSVALLQWAGCKSMGFMSGHPDAVCQVTALDGGAVSGNLRFTKEADDVLVEAEFFGLTPGMHGIHIHEHGDCGGAAAAAAGGHFNPSQHLHGHAAMAESHLGDLGNITADLRGHAILSFKDKWIKLSGENGILGRSVVVHAQEDDLASQPAGNSGARIACGTITAALR